MVVRRPRGADVGQDSRPVDTHVHRRTDAPTPSHGRGAPKPRTRIHRHFGHIRATVAVHTHAEDGGRPIASQRRGGNPTLQFGQDLSHLAAGERVDEVVKFTAIAVHESSERQESAPPAAPKSTFPATVGVSYSRRMVEVLTTQVFDRWLRKLKDRQARLRIVERIDRLSHGNRGDTKPVGHGVWELRLTYGPGYRVYYLQDGDNLVLLLPS